MTLLDQFITEQTISNNRREQASSLAAEPRLL